MLDKAVMWDKHDQAAGLRRLLANVSLQRTVFFSAIPTEVSNLLFLNIGTALVRAGADVQLLDARKNLQGLASVVTEIAKKPLWQTAQASGKPSTAIQEHSTSFHIARLSSKPLKDVLFRAGDTTQLSQLIKDAAHSASYWLTDAGLDYDQAALLPDITLSEIVIITTTAPDSIKSAYGCMKALNTDLGRKLFHVLVVNASEAQAELIQQNIAAAAQRYLGVTIKSLGSVPFDEKLSRAEQMGRPVIELFPTADISAALRRVASKLLNTENSQAVGQAMSTEGQ